jgi:phosphatidylglycerophosphate synthase
VTGKIATVLQMISVLWVLLKWDAGPAERAFLACTIAAAICTGVSGLLYVYDGVRQLSSHPTSLATKQ